MEEQAGVPSPVLLVVQKRLRAAKKKLTRIQELEALQASGKELNSEQVPTVKSKPGVLAIIEELQKVDEGLRDALKEEHAAAFARGVAYGEAQGLAQAEQATTDLRQQLDDLALSHNAALSVLVEQHQQALLDQKDQLEQEGLVAREEAGKIAGEAAIQDALELEMSSNHPLKQILVEPIKKLLSLLYFSQLFDVHHSPYLARGEVYACLQYDAQVERTEGQAALSELALWELAYFGRTLVDRMHNQMSHEQFITSAVDAAMAWVLEPEKVAIPSPPAPTPITVGELQKRVARVLASKFSQVPPTSGPPPDVATGMLPPPPPPLHSTVAPAAFPVAPPAFPVPPPPLPPVPVPAAHPDAAAPGNPVAPPLSSTFNPSAPAASGYPPIQLLPSFFKDGADGDASAVPALGLAPGASSLSNAQSRGPPAPTPTLPQAGAASNMVVPGMYVLSETGIPQLRSSAPTGPPPLQHTMKPGGQ